MLLWVFVAILGILLVLIFFVSCIPFELTFRMQAAGHLDFWMHVAWFFGLVRKDLAMKKTTPDRPKQVKIKTKSNGSWIKTDTTLQIFRIDGMFCELQRLVISTLRCLRLKEFKVDIKVALDDPADTGLLFALIGPATVCLRSIRDDHIKVIPSFEDDAVFEGQAYGVVSLQPVQLVLPLMSFVFSSFTVNMLKVLILNLWKRQT